jgi:hypothetical protein
MQSPARYAEQNEQSAQPVVQELNSGLISTGRATLPPTLLAPPPGDRAASRLYASTRADPIERTNTGYTCAKMLLCALCVLLGAAPCATLLFFAYRSLAGIVWEQPVLFAGLGLLLLVVALRRAQLKKKAKHQQELRVRHARVLRRAGEARISANGSSARLDSADYLRVARGVNSAPVPRLPTQHAGQAQLMVARHSAITQPPTVVDGIAVREDLSCLQAQSGVIVPSADNLSITAGLVSAISLPLENPLC